MASCDFNPDEKSLILFCPVILSNEILIDGIVLSGAVTERVFNLAPNTPGGIVMCQKTLGAPSSAWYHYDGIGNVATESAETGLMTTGYDQEAFGLVYGLYNNSGVYIYGSKNGIPITNAIQNGRHQTTKSYDSRTHMYYFNFRWYDPVIGRFTQQEPLGIDGPNQYHYCSNNPVTKYDPNGLEEEWVIDLMGGPSIPDNFNSISDVWAPGGSTGYEVIADFLSQSGDCLRSMFESALYYISGDYENAYDLSMNGLIDEIDPEGECSLARSIEDIGLFIRNFGIVGALATLGYEQLFLSGESINVAFHGGTNFHLGIEYGWTGRFGYNIFHIGADRWSLFHICWDSTGRGTGLSHLHFFTNNHYLIRYYNSATNTTTEIFKYR